VALALNLPKPCNLLGDLLKPVLVSGQTNHFNHRGVQSIFVVKNFVQNHKEIMERNEEIPSKVKTESVEIISALADVRCEQIDTNFSDYPIFKSFQTANFMFSKFMPHLAVDLANAPRHTA
jgi:hypothetical protein